MNRARNLPVRALGSGLFCLSLWAVQAQAAAGANCSSCHDQGPKLEKSAHAPLACLTCHEKHEKYPHPAGLAKPACTGCHQNESRQYERGVHGQAVKQGNTGAPDCAMCHGSAHELLKPGLTAFRTQVLETCGLCHGEVVGQFRASVHGQALQQGMAQAPLCTDCHGEHSILKHTQGSSPVNAGHIRDTCGSCHGDLRLSRKFGLPADRIVSFDASFHGLAAKAGVQTVANCASCHGVHNILASSDPQSTIHPRNLPATCGRCHAGAGQRFAISPIHVGKGRAEPLAVRWVRRLYLFLIALVIGLMLLHNGGDWVRKTIRLRWPPAGAKRLAAGDQTEIRMFAFERLQHIVLVISFTTLVWTGFALKYPDQWWARPPLLWEGASSARSLVHRVAAAVFMAVAVAHLISLLASPRLRRHWKELWPKASDLTEALAQGAYNLGMRSRQPKRSAHSYVEKAEYWAVVWGAAIMTLTGLMLWANNLMLAFLPKSWLDVATAVHFYEAVLATLAIVVWHFYSVIFDPDVYPMDTAWLAGASVRQHVSYELTVKQHESPETEETKAAK